MNERRHRKRHSPEQIIAKLREADAMLATGSRLAPVAIRMAVPRSALRFASMSMACAI